VAHNKPQKKKRKNKNNAWQEEKREAYPSNDIVTAGDVAAHGGLAGRGVF